MDSFTLPVWLTCRSGGGLVLVLVLEVDAYIPRTECFFNCCTITTSWEACLAVPNWKDMPMVFTPRTAIVTGPDSGIGRATAVALAEAGMDVGTTSADWLVA